MEILQNGFPRIGFHLERHKTGIALTAEAPITVRWCRISGQGDKLIPT